MAMMTGAKLTAVLLCAAAAAMASGCSSLKRFAPPGIVKYEHISDKKSQNPVIKARIAETKKQKQGSFPDLSKEPTKAPEPMPADERAEMISSLRESGDALDAEVAASRAAATAETGAASDKGSLDEARNALDEAVKKDEAAARKEQGMKPRAPTPQN